MWSFVAMLKRWPDAGDLFGFGFRYILSDTEKMVLLLLLFFKSQNELLVTLRVKSSSVILNVESCIWPEKNPRNLRILGKVFKVWDRSGFLKEQLQPQSLISVVRSINSCIRILKDLLGYLLFGVWFFFPTLEYILSQCCILIAGRM